MFLSETQDRCRYPHQLPAWRARCQRLACDKEYGIGKARLASGSGAMAYSVGSFAAAALQIEYAYRRSLIPLRPTTFCANAFLDVLLRSLLSVRLTSQSNEHIVFSLASRLSCATAIDLVGKVTLLREPYLFACLPRPGFAVLDKIASALDDEFRSFIASSRPKTTIPA